MAVGRATADSDSGSTCEAIISEDSTYTRDTPTMTISMFSRIGYRKDQIDKIMNAALVIYFGNDEFLGNDQNGDLKWELHKAVQGTRH